MNKPNRCKAKAIGIMLIVLMSAGIAQASLLDDLRDTLLKFARPGDIFYPSTQSQCTESQLTPLRNWVDNNIPAGTSYDAGLAMNEVGWLSIKSQYGWLCTTSKDDGYYIVYMNSYWTYKYNIQPQYTPPPPQYTPTEGPLPTIEQPRYTPPPEIIPEPIADVIGIEQSPGFDSGLAILGLLITAILVLRRR